MDQEKKQAIQDTLDRIRDHGYDLTKWESDFYESVLEQFTERGTLSPKQFEILGRICDEKAT